MLDQPARRPTATNGAQSAALLRDDRFLRAIGANQHDGVTWFNRERFGHAIDVLGLPRTEELRAAAEKAAYRVDALEKELATKPAKATKATIKVTKPGKATKPTTKAAATTRKPSAKAAKPEAKAPIKPAAKRITSRK